MSTVYPLLRSIGWITVAFLVTCASVRVATIRSNARELPLRDVLHELLSVPCPMWLPDLLLLTCFFVSLFEFIIPSEALVRRACLCYLLRALTMAVTSFPACAPPMDPAVEGRWPLAHVLWGRHDLMFSGHTIAFLAYADLWDTCDDPWARTRGAQRVVRWLLPWTLVWARQHYTVDVIVAYVAYVALGGSLK